MNKLTAIKNPRLFMKWRKDNFSKTININDARYLTRTLIFNIMGWQVWLHEFHTADGDRHLHDHPWNALSIIIKGGYCEETLDGEKWRRAFSPNLIRKHKKHRIKQVLIGTKTLMIVAPSRNAFWYFYDSVGRKVAIKASPREWWENNNDQA